MQGYCTTDEELAQEQAMLTEDERRELAGLDAKAQAAQYVNDRIAEAHMQRSNATHAWDKLQRFVGNSGDRGILIADYDDEVNAAVGTIRQAKGAIDVYCIAFGCAIPEEWAEFYND